MSTVLDPSLRKISVAVASVVCPARTNSFCVTSTLFVVTILICDSSVAVILANSTSSSVPTACPIPIVSVSDATLVSTPVPPVNVRVSVNRLTVSVPVSPAIG